MRSHSTSDDQSLYQDMEEVENWKENNCPVYRLKGYIETRGLWNEVSTIAVSESLSSVSPQDLLYLHPFTQCRIRNLS